MLILNITKFKFKFLINKKYPLLSTGWNCLHSLANIILAYCLLHQGGPTLTTVVCSFILNLGYLHVAYYCRSLDEFMLDWSVPHCILCLRLIGIAWDYYDGNNFNNNKISEDMKATRISTPPTLFEMTGFCYFFGGVLVGPQ
ncbi:lysophospholipid acyltransferase 5-like, partial [Actinia tenebrosa]|uniref:Lysophospholipid acyltransferase 5 n=1 Tax=Actinia tenebrosa TaxID=6105 RepID=A0A6P8HNI0_ACTTE